MNKGHRLSLQYHAFKDETMTLESGNAYLTIGETLATLKRVDMQGGVSYHIPPGMIHRLCAVSNTLVLEVSTSEIDDVFRVEDDYSR